MSSSIPRSVLADSVARWQRPRHDPAGHFARTCTFQGCGQRIEGGPRGHYIVDQRNMLARNVPHAGEGAAHIAPPRVVLQSLLRRRVADTLTARHVERNVVLSGDFTRDFDGMIETAFADTARMQRHRNQAVRPGMDGHGLGQTIAQQGPNGEPAMIFQTRDQAGERERIRQRGHGAVKCGRMLEAGPAYAALGCGGRALRTLGLRMPRQRMQTVGTKAAMAVGCAAKQACGRYQMLK